MMADARLTTIHKKIQELLAVNHTTYSGVDLSGAVVRGSVVQPPYTPFGCVFFVDCVEQYEGATLGRYKATANFEAYLFVGGATVIERNDNALNLASDGVKALTANRQLGLGLLVDDVLLSYTAVNGDKYGLSGIGIGMIRISVKFVSDDGT
tara:strand:+ start:1907 stop:2362 length:456 start_codon:yes stop_codon:yes gene_type:complete